MGDLNPQRVRLGRVPRTLRTAAPRALAALTLGLGIAVVTAAPAVAAAPSAPQSVNVTPGPTVGNMTIRWSSPASTGGVAITGFQYQVHVDAGAFGAPLTLGPSTARSAVVPCAAPATTGHGCTYEVRAINGTSGAWSAPVAAVWSVPSPAVLGRALAGPGAGVATLQWRPSASTGGLAVSYEYEVSTGTGFGAPVAIAPGSISLVPGEPWPVDSAAVTCPLGSGPVVSCSYVLLAVNGVGASPVSVVRTAVEKRPGAATGITASNTSVALGTGLASQTVVWTPPTVSGGTPVTDNRVWVCATANGTPCTNVSTGWTQVTDLVGTPPASTTPAVCPANGRCGYEVWPTNAVGHSWAVGYSHPSPPTTLMATASLAAPGQVTLSWQATPDSGTAFGHYVLFECDSNQTCTNGSWTANPADAAPWNVTQLTATPTATTTQYPCGVVHACTFEIGYIDASGHIGGVTNSVITTGLDAPTLTAVPGATPGAVNLSWTTPATGQINQYEIDRDTGSGLGFLADVPAAPTSYIDTTCGAGVTCHYTVRALLFPSGTSPASNEASATAPLDSAIAITTPVAGARLGDSTPTFSGTAATANSATVTVKVWVGALPSGTLQETLTTTRAATAWTVDATTLPDGTYTVQAQQTTPSSGVVLSPPITFTTDTTGPTVSITSVNGAAHALPFSTSANVTSIGGACGTATGDNATVSVAIGGAGSETGTAPGTAGAWAYTLVTPLTTGGAYTATVTQGDSTLNTGTTGTQSISIDKTAPVVTVTTVNGTVRALPLSTATTVTSIGGACGTLAGDAATVSIAITGASTQNGTAACTAGAWSFAPASALSADGVYSLTATQTDAAGNTGTSGAQTVTVDKTAPVVTLTTVNGTARTFPFLSNATITTVGGACGVATGDAPSVSLTLTGAGSENGVAACTAGVWTYTFVSALTVNGAYSVTATQTDAVSNTGTSGAKTVNLDTTAPTLTLTTINGTVRTFPFTTNTTVSTFGGVCGSASGDSASVNVSITGAATQSSTAACTAGAWSFSPAPALSTSGVYSLSATQSDTAGNTAATGAQSLTINTLAPTVTLTTVNGTARTFPLTTNATATSVGGTCTTAAGVNPTVTVAISGASTQSGSATCTTGAWTFTLTTALSADGVYAATATQSDTSGNTGSSGAQGITVDKTAPTVALSAVNGTTHTFPYTANVSVTSLGGTCGAAIGDSTSVAIAITGASTQNGTATCSAGVWTFTPATALSSDGVYTVTGTQTDAATNSGTTGAQTITVDKTAPTVTLASVNGTARTFPFTTNTTATTVGGICGTASGDAATVAVVVGGAGSESGAATCTSGSWTYTFATALAANGTYTVTATQTDTAGNIGSSGTKSITVDTTAPVVTLTTANGAGRTFPFTTNATVTSFGGACGSAVGDGAGVTVSITGASTQSGTATCTAGVWTFTPTTALSAEGTYSVNASQSDTASNTGSTGAQTITVDKTAPVVTLTTANGTVRTFPYLSNAVVTTVAGACGTAAGDSATVSVSVTGAGSENGAATCTTGAWSYTFVSSLAVNGAYSVTATQTDGAANNGTSGAKTITVDTTAPVITLTSVNGTVRSFPYTTNTNVTTVGGACGSASGDIATISVAITGASTQSGTATCGSGTWTFSPTTALSADGTYSITATQTDTAANTGTTGAQSVTINTLAPIVTLATVNGTAQTFPFSTNATVTSVGGACTTAAGVNPTVSVSITGVSTQSGSATCTASAWSFTPGTALSAEGVYSVTATQTDNSANTGSSGARSITVDKTAPTVALTGVNGTIRTFPFTTASTVTTFSGTCGGSLGDAGTVAIAITGASTQNGTATCSAGTWSFSPVTAFSTDGGYVETITQTDASGNTGTTGAQTITVDKTAPVVTIAAVNGTARTFPFSTNANVTTVGGACGTLTGDGPTVSVSVTGGSTQSGTAACTTGAWTFTLTTPLSAVGSYAVTASQSDSVANIGTSGAADDHHRHHAARRHADDPQRRGADVPDVDQRDGHVGRRHLRHARGRRGHGLDRDHRREHPERHRRLHRRRLDLHARHRPLGGRHLRDHRPAE